MIDRGGAGAGLEGGVPRGSEMFRRILVGWDGSAAAETALSAALHLVERYAGGGIVALSVLAPASHAEAGEDRARDLASARRLVVERLSEVMARLGLDPADERIVHHVLEDPHPATAIATYAVDHGFDLVIVGRRGRSGPGPLIGSVADRLVRAAAVPVLLVDAAGA